MMSQYCDNAVNRHTVNRQFSSKLSVFSISTAARLHTAKACFVKLLILTEMHGKKMGGDERE